VIVRIATDDQFRLPDELVDQLNGLDDEAQQAVEAGDNDKFQSLLKQMVDLIHEKGERVADDELVSSEVIIPPPDATIDEVGEHFDGEGLIPG
jgi:hypothetical protein